LFLADCRRTDIHVFDVAIRRHLFEFTNALDFTALHRFGRLLDDRGDRLRAELGFIDAEAWTQAGTDEGSPAVIRTAPVFSKGRFDPHVPRLQTRG
jgi:hypothetical protein